MEINMKEIFIKNIKEIELLDSELSKVVGGNVLEEPSRRLF